MDERTAEMLSFGRNRIDTDFLAASAPLKLHDTGHAGEESMVPSQAHVEAGKEFRTPLTNENGTGLHQLAAVSLDPRYWGLLSRPFLVEPPPLLVAISSFLLCGRYVVSMPVMRIWVKAWRCPLVRR
jgi:hypothetical protein